MSPRWSYVTILFSLALLSGCSQQRLMQLSTPAGAEEAASRYVNLLRARQFDQIEADFAPNIVNDETAETLATMADAIPDGDPLNYKVVGSNIIFGRHPPIENITLEYEFPDDRWLLANLQLAKVNGQTILVGFHTQPEANSLENSNRFTIRGKGSSQFFVAFLALLMVSVNVHAFIICLRTQGLRLKWLWLIVTLISAARLTVNWTTGQTFITPVAINIPAAQATELPYQPWYLSASLPIGALAFYAFRERKTGHLFRAYTT